ncbi:hypothetical protein V3565_04080 [Bartonella sp. B10]
MDNKIVQQNDIFIENYGSGRFEGFRFYSNKSSADQISDTQNLENNENLIMAFTKRATRFCSSANGDFTLSSDGTVRWIGQPVGKLIATENFLNPKPILLADAQLTGEARDQVVQRLERFVIFHFETALKPLFDLRNADTLTNSTTDLALRLVNSLGILPRREIAEIVKNLDQESRSVLRRLGVRFGAFHIYVAAILKPTPVKAIMLLWNLKNENHDKTGLNEIFTALDAGRTSLVVDPTYNHKFYQLAGYRVLGQRAVRIDILERLANLIRPALHWKQGIEPKPDGAYDGKSFFVTPAMMSILGANGTDMEEILKGLGYQSYPCSNTVIEQTLLQDKISTHANTTDNVGCHASTIEQNIPEAECVGDQWQKINTSETKQEEKRMLSSCAEEQIRNINHLPAAEPVGNLFKQKQIIAGDKIVLLWRYNHYSHKNRNKSGQIRRNKHKEVSKTENGTNQNTLRNSSTHNKRFSKSKTTHTKHSHHKVSRIDKQLNPDSPFAKLAALRDKLTNDKDSRTLPCNNYELCDENGVQSWPM